VVLAEQVHLVEQAELELVLQFMEWVVLVLPVVRGDQYMLVD
jgi:hypothetical protein